MTLRAIFYEEEHALAVVQQLVANGFEATLGREWFAGEDDDEDHPWAVTTDAPEVMVEMLVEQFDGWLDDGGTGPDTSAPSVVPPLDLPQEPRRIKNHFPRD